MRLLMTLLCGIAFAFSANAQTVEIRSGQHDGFIRLIVDLPERVAVQIDNWREEAVITLPGQELRFETSRIFNRISRDRLRDVVASGEDATLRLKLGCNCEVSSFWHGKSLLVLDVRDTDTILPSISTITSPTPDEGAQMISQADQTRTSTNRRFDIPEGTVSLAASLAKSQLQKETTAPEVQNPPASETTDASDSLAREAREHLVRQLSRAATQGLISPRSSLARPSEAQETQAPRNEEAQTLSPASPQAAEHMNLRAQSSIDRDFLAAIEEGMSGLSAPACADGRALDVSSWGTDAPFAEQVGPLRKDLIGEFDQVNVDAVLQLTRLYLYFGFGAEARQTLSMTDGDPDNSKIFLALASIMEDGHAEPDSALANQLNCDGPQTLWSVLSYETLPQNAEIDKDVALRTFDALPRQLRSHLGPVLSRRFLEAGDQKTADNVLRILNRHEETRTAGADLVEAEIDRADGESAKAMDGLEAVVETNTELSAQALIELIDTSIQSEEVVSFDHAILAGAYLQQNRGGVLENDLVRVYLTGLAASGAFDQSYKEHARLVSDLPSGLLGEIDSEMLNQLTQLADEITFLRHVFAGTPKDHGNVDPRISNAAALRLLEAGFADAARPFVAQDIAGKLGLERKLLRAKIAIREGQPRQAEAAILNVDGADADLLRAEARSMTGDHLAAADLYASNGEQERSQRQAWLAEDWGRLLQSQENTLANGAALAMLNDDQSQVSESQSPDLNSDRILSQNRSLIQQSSTARQTIQDVLDANPSPGLE